MHYLTKATQRSRPIFSLSKRCGNRLYARTISTQELNSWKIKTQREEKTATDTITASQINLLGNTLDHSRFNRDQLPSHGAEIPQGWHLGFFPVRVPEKELAKEGYHKDWSPPEPYTHRIWAGGKVKWNVENPLCVGDEIKMKASLGDVKQENDAIYVWVNRTVHSNRGLALSESRCCIYTKGSQMREEEVSTITDEKSTIHDVLSNPDFTFSVKPTAITLFRFSALTFNAHRIHYDHVYATEVEKQKGCLTHGPLSLLFLVNQLDHYLATKDFDQHKNRKVKSVEYRCLNPLPVNEPVTVCGKWKTDVGLDPTYDLWIVDNSGKIAVKGLAVIDEAK